MRAVGGSGALIGSERARSRAEPAGPGRGPPVRDGLAVRRAARRRGRSRLPRRGRRRRRRPPGRGAGARPPARPADLRLRAARPPGPGRLGPGAGRADRVLRAGPRRLGRLHEDRRPGRPGGIRWPADQHPPGAAAGLPRGARGARRPRRRGDRHREHRAPGRRRRRHRPGARPAGGPRPARGRRGEPARTHQDGGARAPGGDGGGPGHRERDEGEPSMTDRSPIRRALLGVYDKSGIEELARGLAAAGVELVSTGATARRIAEAGVPVTPVEKVTGFPECLDGRVKTLHPAVHAGILADRRKAEHSRQLEELGIAPFDLVVVNLYPFTETVASGAAPDECVEQIDIGGPAMVRAAAKNHPSVAVVVDPARYDDVLAAVQAGGFTLAERQRLAAAAFRHTASYDIAVASWMGNVLAPDDDSGFPAWTGASGERADVLRYGETPHQRAALYRHWRPGLAHAEQLHGKAMSYNNYVDTDAAWRAAHAHNDPCVAIIKHANPCGIAVGADIASAHRKAHACDPVSAFGGVIAANREVDLTMAEQVAEVFTEVVVAPSFTDDALAVLRGKKNIRILRLPHVPGPRAELRPVSGGLLLQTADTIDAPGDDPTTWTLAG